MDDALRLMANSHTLILPIPVLILVLMDDALRQFSNQGSYWRKQVLILVLMDDALRPKGEITLDELLEVLILVLMDDALRRPTCQSSRTRLQFGLNPCFNG